RRDTKTPRRSSQGLRVSVAVLRNLALEQERGVLDGHLLEELQLLGVELRELAGDQVVVLAVGADLDAVDLRLEQGAVERPAEVREEAPGGEHAMEVDGGGGDPLAQRGAGAADLPESGGEFGSVELDEDAFVLGGAVPHPQFRVVPLRHNPSLPGSPGRVPG